MLVRILPQAETAIDDDDDDPELHFKKQALHKWYLAILLEMKVFFIYHRKGYRMSMGKTACLSERFKPSLII